jgi:serine/threonine protein kinase/Tol biopolymer transport system component
LRFHAGTRLGPYEIQSALGAGGMGEVYKARDTRLDRTVAIKILPEALAGDPQFRDRFDREARTISQLDHPHICALYDVGEERLRPVRAAEPPSASEREPSARRAGGGAPAPGERWGPASSEEVVVRFLVMQYLEGETLEQRLKSGALPIQEALTIAMQIADALATAHQAGIIHRDLKPGNIILTKAGAKLLDFGLAKTRPVVTGGGLSMLPTTPPGLTAQGTILGTFQYMAPEQLEGREADARTDLFAFGAVVYEMLAGKKAFEGKNQASLIGAILHIDPPAVTTLRPLVPPLLDRVVEKCLRKDADHRWQTARDLLDELKWIAEGGTAVAPVGARTRNPWLERVAWMTAAAGVLIALFLVPRSASAPATGEVVRLSILPPDKARFTGQNTVTVGVPQLALSPDGRAIVFAAAAPGARPSLWLRSLDAVTAHSLPGTEGAESPFWSPDHRWIGYFADGKLKKIPASGGPSQVIAVNVSENRGASWGPDDTILFSTSTTGILRVSSSGGMVTPVLELDASRQEGSHRFPQFLPDGRHFLFQVRSSLADQPGVYAGSLDGKTKRLLIRGSTTALYAPSGHVLFVDGDTLMGQAFDAERLELRGQAFVVEGGVGRSSTGNGSYSVSGTGTLAFAGTLTTPGRLTWFDRHGNSSESAGSLGDYTDFRLSPDQTRLAASVTDPKTGYPDIWITDLTRRSSAPFTFGPAVNASPVWAPDGARIIFRTTRTGGFTEFYAKSAGGGGKEEPVLSQTVTRASSFLSSVVILSDWSPDGRHLLFSANTSSDYDLWLVPVAGAPKPVSFLSAPGDQWHGNFSPDGRLVAYSSNESGRFEVHVQTFPLTDRQWTVSTTGGYEPRWRADGHEVYYLSLDQKLMAVAVGPGPSFGAPTELFQVRVPEGTSAQRTHYVPSRDGRRFLVNTPTGDASMVPITVVLNWTAALKK